MCDTPLTRRNKTGLCVKHNKSGDRNPMAGRSVYSRWVEKYGEEEAKQKLEQKNKKTSQSSKEKWQDAEYRSLVKKTTTGLKRSNEFREKQRQNALRQFEDPDQRELRSKAIRASYERGTHNTDTLASNQYGIRGFTEDGIFYASKVEKSRIEFLQRIGARWKRYEVRDFDFRIKYIWEDKEHLYLPDFIIWHDDKIIIEEMKSNLKYISDREWAKAKSAGLFLKTQGIDYHLNDDPQALPWD